MLVGVLMALRSSNDVLVVEDLGNSVRGIIFVRVYLVLIRGKGDDVRRTSLNLDSKNISLLTTK